LCDRNLDDLNAQLRHWLDTVANPRVHATTQYVVNEAFAVAMAVAPRWSRGVSAGMRWTGWPRPDALWVRSRGLPGARAPSPSAASRRR
jgi:hypothetical protein